MTDPASRFPDTYAAIDRALLIHAYVEGPDRIQKALTGLTPDDLEARPSAGAWSIKEIVIHLADAELMGAARVRQVVAEPGSTFAAYNQETWADRFGYQDFSDERWRAARRLFVVLRETTRPLFEQAADDAWHRTAVHPEWGPLSLRQVLELYADHSERHLAQILDRRARLGKLLDLPLLLPDRLY